MNEAEREAALRAAWLAIFTKLGPKALAAHCGGRGMVIGCPVCRKRWPS